MVSMPHLKLNGIIDDREDQLSWKNFKNNLVVMVVWDLEMIT